MRGQIHKIYSDMYYVKVMDSLIPCKMRELLKKRRISVVTGDFVEVEKDVITEIYPRKTYIKRPSVANVDQLVVVSALKEPELDFCQLNRYVSLAKYYKIPVVLCFNKEDLGLDDSLQDSIISIYENLGYKIIFTSALKKIGLKDLSKVLNGKISALCGNSGVGKSSLINSLNPNFKLRTKDVSEKLKRGTHTTRHCEIMQLDKGTYIVDTPGFSNVKFDFILPKDIDKLFDEIYMYKSGCKFSDCLHINEADCEVLKNIEQIHPTRYESYLDFVKEAFEYKEKIKYNGKKEETFQKLNNNKSVAKISEKKRQGARNTQKQNMYKGINYENE